ncbi:MAG TPA: AMP-binding protein [Acidimicrobiales bacterium]|nr:AMP-binding protein [Acidimicrobiales bacterium]
MSENPMFEIEEVEIRGQQIKVFKNAPPSIRALWQLAAIHGDATYLVYEDRRYTYRQAQEISHSFAAHLVSLGVQKGDRVAIAMRNLPEFPLAFWAAASIGAVVVPLNAWWSGPELAYGLADSGARVLVADDERLARVEEHLGETAVEHVFTNVEDFPTAPLPDVAIDPEDDATILYTSGTTGRPKGAVGTNRNFCAHVMNAMYGALEGAAAGDASTAGAAAPAQAATVLTFPLFHVGGLQSTLAPLTMAGGKIVLIFKWDTQKVLDLIHDEQITIMAGVPTTMFELLDEAKRQGRDLGAVSSLASGATLVPPELVKRIDQQAHASPGNGYGLTETSGAAVSNGGSNYVSRPDSVGRPASPVMEVKIVDENNHEVPTGETGEICIKGPTVFRGYFNLPEATAAAIVEGWFHTGDVGRLDEDGYLYVVDRIKDVIIRGGENIYAAEIEAVLYEHPDVFEAAIVGLPDEKYGEIVGAFVRLHDGATATPDDLRTWVADRLAAFKVPAVVEIRTEELPRNATGKVLKRELRETHKA